MSGQAAAFARRSGVDVGSVTRLTGGTVERQVGDGLHVEDLDGNVFGGAFAEGELVVHLATDVADVVVDHRQGDDDRQDGNDRKRDCRVGHELVGLHAAIGLHFSEVWSTTRRAVVGVGEVKICATRY